MFLFLGQLKFLIREPTHKCSIINISDLTNIINNNSKTKPISKQNQFDNIISINFITRNTTLISYCTG